jgi:hypothetical protein
MPMKISVFFRLGTWDGKPRWKVDLGQDRP